MALINCPDCNKEISDQASSCIQCGRPMMTEVEGTSQSDDRYQQHLVAGWNTVTKARTPINVFTFGMMSCSAILGLSAMGIDNTFDLTAFKYTLHIFLALSGMFFVTILFCRKGIYHPEDLARAKEAGVTDLGKDKPELAVLSVVLVLLFYGIYQFVMNRIDEKTVKQVNTELVRTSVECKKTLNKKAEKTP